MLTTKNICAQMETRVFCIPLPQVGLCEGGHVATKRAAEFAECYRDALERSGDDAPSLRGAGAARTSRKVVAFTAIPAEPATTFTPQPCSWRSAAAGACRCRFRSATADANRHTAVGHKSTDSATTRSLAHEPACLLGAAVQSNESRFSPRPLPSLSAVFNTSWCCLHLPY